MGKMIFLIGFRGTGKTTIGELLARRLGYAFVDTDKQICRKKGSSIRTIVENEGWDAFRRLEQGVLEELAGMTGSVVATGGGAVLHHHVWQQLKRAGVIVWLMADGPILMQRIKADVSTQDNRPSLSGKGVAEEMMDILKQREPLYRDIAHFAVDTGELGANEAVEKICEKAAKMMVL